MKDNKDIKEVEYPIMSVGPNRKQRRMKLVPSSTKMAACSLRNPTVYRTGKFSNNY